ncbi:MAG TPA: response regulator transcription factor [Candidatus Mediterraneibacter merdipullorum]|nr:response regulator transcription factor [Candidatus Mediterraneibacter merdipullorum]
MTIGILEDDRLLNQALDQFLTDNGYDTVCAHSGEEALASPPDRPDLWLIDIGLPDGNGLEVYRRLSAVRNVPAVFLTARDDERDMLQAFDSGADDYVVKPFSMKVLLKRIERVLRRKTEGRVLTCGDITMYPEKKQVFSGAEEMILTAKEYQLLELFMENQGQVLTKENILDRVWGIDGAFIEENTVSVTLSRLKKKLGGEQSHIRNVFGMGYRMGE